MRNGFASLTLLAVAAPTSGFAQVQDQVVISDQGASSADGRIAANFAAGDGNQEINSTVVAIGDVALDTTAVHQIMAGGGERDRATRVEVRGSAFANTSGIGSINAAAGIQNQLANIATLSIGRIGVISDQLLEQSRAPTEPSGYSGGVDSRNDAVVVSDDAFRDSSGLMQVNLVGGERNSSANTFVLSVLAEGAP